MCKCVCVCADALSLLHTLTANSQNREHGEKHLASVCFIVVEAPKLGHKERTCVWQNIGCGECVWIFDYVVFA